ncbi:DUF2919 domain-containing protein [Agarivorans sp. TSD2052]|uniref:DUF2919 family protein n=1 Tax=Agarivorans sp. TSD2052 TaxID=2937286 RepID=UPI00200DE0E0|nr:DUF2919 family protein [Agarivorans sp. TSD2052]UPW16849.1 DUF2919 domain-containing protein [Agarivorans sp. TSD2052]
MLLANQPSVLFACALLSRTWLLLAIAASSRQVGDKILALLYPDHHWFYLGLAMGALPLTRLVFPKLWQKLSIRAQLWGIFALLLVDIASQVQTLNLNHWRFEALNAVTLWLSLMISFIVFKSALEKP